MLPIFRPYLYDVNYARKARELSDETYPQSKPLIRGGLADDRLADESLGTIVDPQTGVVIPEEKLWRETKVRQYGEQLPTEHRIMTPLMRYSPLTLVYMANLVRRLPVEEGLLQLQFLQKRMAPLIREEIFQGYLEAIRRGLDREKLVIGASLSLFLVRDALTHRTDEIKVLQSKARKSLDLRAQGQIRIIRSRTCRMIITLKEAISPLEEKRRKLEKALKRRQRVGGAMASTRVGFRSLSLSRSRLILPAGAFVQWTDVSAGEAASLVVCTLCKVRSQLTYTRD